MSESHTVELDKTMTMNIVVYDEYSGWSCRLERWFSENLEEWFTGVTIFDESHEVCHAGMTDLHITKEAALQQIECTRLFLEERW